MKGLRHMLDMLKHMYGENFIYNQKPSSPENYIWYQTDEGVPFAIRRHVMTDNEKKLLSLSFKPFDAYLKNNYSEKELFWNALLFEDHPLSIQAYFDDFQFIHFHCKQSVLEKEDLTEALLGLFPSSSIILWVSEHHGVIILLEAMDESINYLDIIDSIATDLYLDISLYVGIKQPLIEKAKVTFAIQEKTYLLMQKLFPKQKVFLHQSSLPINLVHLWLSQNTQLNFESLITVLDSEDDEFLDSINVFLESNLNISIASKKLYVHRNSLQYRIDKFHEKTGLNPKEFSDAVIISLLLLHKKMKPLMNSVQSGS